jgi:hypothetical protein
MLSHNVRSRITPSASFHASLQLWKYVLIPELECVVEMNDALALMKQMIEAMEKQIDN